MKNLDFNGPGSIVYSLAVSVGRRRDIISQDGESRDVTNHLGNHFSCVVSEEI